MPGEYAVLFSRRFLLLPKIFAPVLTRKCCEVLGPSQDHTVVDLIVGR